MKVSMIFAGLVAVAVAAPIEVRTPGLTHTVHVDDIDIMQFVLSLEQMVDAFYKQGLNNYTNDDFIKAGFDKNFRP